MHHDLNMELKKSILYDTYSVYNVCLSTVSQRDHLGILYISRVDLNDWQRAIGIVDGLYHCLWEMSCSDMGVVVEVW